MSPPLSLVPAEPLLSKYSQPFTSLLPPNLRISRLSRVKIRSIDPRNERHLSASAHASAITKWSFLQPSGLPEISSSLWTSAGGSYQKQLRSTGLAQGH